MSRPPVNAVRISTTDPDNQTYLLLQNNDRVDIELIDKDGYTLDTIILTLAHGHLTRVARPNGVEGVAASAIRTLLTTTLDTDPHLTHTLHALSDVLEQEHGPEGEAP